MTRTVSRFEANLLSILRFFLGRAPAAQAVPLLATGLAMPPCLSRAAVDLVRDTLAKGCVLALAGDVGKDGWKRQRFLRDGRIAEGRLWERTPPEALGLAISRHSLRFLMWATAAELPARPKSQPPAEELTVGDRLLFYRAYAALRERPVGEGLGTLTVFSGNVLCRLAFPGDFAEPPPDFGHWTTGVGACILEALQGELRRCWLELESDKSRRSVGAELRAVGQAQDQVATALVDALGVAGRRDLGRFILDAAVELLGGAADPFAWVERFDLSRDRLAERTETYRAVLALPRCLLRLRDWDRQARSVGYLDEGYAAAQLWKSTWEEARGDEHCRRAEGIIRRISDWGARIE